MTAFQELYVTGPAAISSLGLPMLATDASVTLASNPTSAVGQFRLSVGAVSVGLSVPELMLVASPATVGTTYAVIARGIEGTTAAVHALGTPASVVLTGDSLERLVGQPAASVANPAAVTALAPSAAWPSGTTAFALSTNQTFQLIQSSVLTADGVTVLAATAAAGGGRWVDTRKLAYIATQNAQAVPAWWIDPVNGSDSNSGTSVGSPLKTYAMLAYLWGTTSPSLAQNTTLTFLGTGHFDDSDPVICKPILSKGATLTIQGTLTTVQSFTLSSVTAKNRTTPQLLQGNLGSSVAPNLLITNTTKPSNAWSYLQVSGNVYSITQPLLTPLLALGEVDTWANGDACTSSTVTNVNLASIDCTADASGLAAVIVQNLTVFDPSGTPGTNTVSLGHLIVLTNVLIQRYVFASAEGQSPGGTVTTTFVNCRLLGDIAGGSMGALTQIYGGAVDVAFHQPRVNFYVDFDVILGPHSAPFWGAGITGEGGAIMGTFLGNVYVTTALRAGGATQITSLAGSHGIVWGPGVLDVQAPGALIYDTAQNAVTTFPLIGGLLLSGANTATSVTGTYTFSTVSLTPAHLDAAAGAAGFGGVAFRIGGASIRSSNTF